MNSKKKLSIKNLSNIQKGGAFVYKDKKNSDFYEKIFKQLKDGDQNIDVTKEQICIKTRQYAKRQRTWARSQMSNWERLDYKKLASYSKKIKISLLKLDQ